jgi:hypothetical protein
MQRLYLNKDGKPWYVTDSVEDARSAGTAHPAIAEPASTPAARP